MRGSCDIGCGVGEPEFLTAAGDGFFSNQHPFKHALRICQRLIAASRRSRSCKEPSALSHVDTAAAYGVASVSGRGHRTRSTRQSRHQSKG